MFRPLNLLLRRPHLVYNSYKMVDGESLKEHLQSHLYGAIVEKIISGEFASGERLVEDELARTYNVSRTPIREVLFALENDGLVERVRNQGARVASFTPDDVEEVFDIRRALECFCVPNAIRTLKLNELMDLERELAAQRASRTQDCGKTHAAIDVRLHNLIVGGSGNRRLISYMSRLSLLRQSLQLAGYHNEEYVRQAAAEHLAIIRAMLRRDVKLTEALLADHIESGKRHALELFFVRSNTSAKYVSSERR